ncbi:MAG: DUF3109 family protein [Bacteroidia bacterium]|nr:DUF3109 family protein [Bacteroidia bacterium]
MIAIDDTLVSEDLIEKQFVCDLSKCKGACCIEGDAGAPLEMDEVNELRKNYKKIKPFLTEKGKAEIEAQGLSVIDDDLETVTPLIDGDKECAFTVFEDGVAKCGIERSWEAGKSNFRKPISCHLYPVRLTKHKGYIAVNYDKWEICSAACELGSKLMVPVYVFLKDALLKRFGHAWYSQLDAAAKHINGK